MTCRELVGVLAAYLETSLAPDAVARLEAHLQGCDECRAYLATYRRTMAMTGRAGRVAMPAEMRRRLLAFLLGELRTQRS